MKKNNAFVLVHDLSVIILYFDSDSVKLIRMCIVLVRQILYAQISHHSFVDVEHNQLKALSEIIDVLQSRRNVNFCKKRNFAWLDDRFSLNLDNRHKNYKF